MQVRGHTVNISPVFPPRLEMDHASAGRAGVTTEFLSRWKTGQRRNSCRDYSMHRGNAAVQFRAMNFCLAAPEWHPKSCRGERPGNAETVAATIPCTEVTPRYSFGQWVSAWPHRSDIRNHVAVKDRATPRQMPRHFIIQVCRTVRLWCMPSPLTSPYWMVINLAF